MRSNVWLRYLSTAVLVSLGVWWSLTNSVLLQGWLLLGLSVFVVLLAADLASGSVRNYQDLLGYWGLLVAKSVILGVGFLLLAAVQAGMQRPFLAWVVALVSTFVFAWVWDQVILRLAGRTDEMSVAASTS